MVTRNWLKEDVETSSKSLNPTPKADVKTMFPTAVRSLAPTNAPHEEREVKKSSSRRRSLRAAFDKSNVDEIPKGETRYNTIYFNSII